MSLPDKNFQGELRASAGLGRAWSRRYCGSALYGAGSCDWYHGYWQFFSALGVVATPWRQADFFANWSRVPARPGQPARILISGATDYAMLAVVSRARNSLTTAYTVVDLCETPLALNRWYAARHRLHVTTRGADIRRIEFGRPFDMVCSHSVLGNFQQHEHRQLLAAWHRHLNPGGLVVTAYRERPGQTGTSRFDSAGVRHFVERVAESTSDRSSFSIIDRSEILSAARNYANRYSSHPLTNPREFLDLAESVGFERIFYSREGGRPDQYGPSENGDAGRALLVLRRL